MSAGSPDEEGLFHAARRIADPDARALFLSQACGGNTVLAERVHALLDMFAQEPESAGLTKSRTADFEPVAERIGTAIGPYVLREKIGEGGFGLVFVAEQIEPVRRKVALKVIKPGMDSAQIVARFEAERQALALMDHPNIARVLDAGTTHGEPGCASSGRPYFVMELVRGIPITRYCDQNHLSPNERLELFVTACQAIQHAHQKGVIHRDIKPSNVLVTSHDGRPVAKVIDFGVAKAIHQQLTDHSIYTNFAQMIGTPLYMSPEQAEMSGLDIDTRSDIYSLGVLLYELLTGTTPLDRQRLRQAAYDEVRRLIREEEPPKPSTRLSTSDSIASVAAQRKTEPARLSKLMRGDLDWITMKALEKDRTRRYETANALARDIQRYLSDEPVEACPPTRGYRLRKFARKNRVVLSTAATIGLLFIAGISVSAWQAVRATNAERAERLSRLEAEAAAAGERAAREQTQKRLTQIEKGVELFAAMLTGINPRNEEKDGPSLYEQLRRRAEKAADELDAESVGDPLAVARLQVILGAVLRELGNAEKAIEIMEKAIRLQESKLGADHLQTLTSRNNLAVAYYVAGQPDKALPILEATLKAREAKLRADHPDTLMSRINLAAAYRAAGQLDKALPLYQATLQVQEAVLGADHPDTLISRNNLAAGYYAAGQLDRALPLFEATLKARETTLARDHPDTLMSRHNLALAYQDAGQMGKALPLYESTLKLHEQKFGSEHPGTLRSRHHLAVAYRAAGQLEKALPLFERSALEFEKRNYQHESARKIVSLTIECFEQLGDFAAAESWQRKWLAHVREKFGGNSTQAAAATSSLGRILIRRNKFADAERELRAPSPLARRTNPTLGPLFTLGPCSGALLGQQKLIDAEPLLLEGYQGMMARAKAIPPSAAKYIPETLDYLIELYTAADRPLEVRKWQSEPRNVSETAEQMTTSERV